MSAGVSHGRAVWSRLEEVSSVQYNARVWMWMWMAPRLSVDGGWMDVFDGDASRERERKCNQQTTSQMVQLRDNPSYQTTVRANNGLDPGARRVPR